jgi:hypothetical protein
MARPLQLHRHWAHYSLTTAALPLCIYCGRLRAALMRLGASAGRRREELRERVERGCAMGSAVSDVPPMEGYVYV